jgi:hypothetical protein
MLLRSGYFVLGLRGHENSTDHEVDETGSPRSIGETRAPLEKRGASMRRLIARITATLAALGLAVGIAVTGGHAVRPADGSSWSLAGSSWSFSTVQQPHVWGPADRR